MKSITHHICEIDARHRLLFALGIAAVCYFALGSRVSLPTRLVATWDTFAGSALAATWVTIIAAEHTHIRQKARTQDLSRKLILVMIYMTMTRQPLGTASAKDYLVGAGMASGLDVAAVATVV